MKIKISDSLTLGEWYQLDNGYGHLVREWIRQDDSLPQLVGTEHWNSSIPRIYIYPNACASLAVAFTDSTRIFSKTFRECTPEYTENGLLDWDRIEEAKKIVDDYLIRVVKMKMFL